MGFSFSRIPVRLGLRRYEIRIGVRQMDRFGSFVRRLACGTHPVLVTNPTIWKGQARSVAHALAQSGFPVRTLLVPDTERSKSMEVLSRLLNRLADLDGPGRRLFLVLVGGGVVGDLGGVAAGLYRRGIPYIQVPTTLLAQVDSAIGGKTGVDLAHGKNLVGLIVQPRGVFIDLQFLSSLPERQFCSGLAEVIKCGVIRDRLLFQFLEETSVDRLRRSVRDLAWVITRAVKVKVDLVEKDERETRGIRTLLNFGHTFGHALEAAAGYSRAFTHGEAISIGMRVACDISCRLGLFSPPQADRIGRVLSRFRLPETIRGVRLAPILWAMSHDKKWSGGENRWVLPVGIGRAVVRRDVPPRIIRAAIQHRMEG